MSARTHENRHKHWQGSLDGEASQEDWVCVFVAQWAHKLFASSHIVFGGCETTICRSQVVRMSPCWCQPPDDVSNALIEFASRPSSIYIAVHDNRHDSLNFSVGCFGLRETYTTSYCPVWCSLRDARSRVWLASRPSACLPSLCPRLPQITNL